MLSEPGPVFKAKKPKMEVDEGQSIKLRISAKVLDAQRASGLPFNIFITKMIDPDLACWNVKCCHE